MLTAPRIWRIGATSALFTPEPDCAWFHVRMPAGGGGGAGTSNQHFIPPNQYGHRGGDSYFHLRPAVTAMFALAPGGATVHYAAPHNLVPDQTIFLENIPPGVGLHGGPYFPINLTANSHQLSAAPYEPPFGSYGGGTQTPLVVQPVGQNPSIDVRVTWYGTQGGGGGGIIGDQGTPLGYWGLDGLGPEGYVQGFGLQGGAGHGAFRMGAPGGVNPFGGNSGSAYQDFGIAGSNLTGAGGGGGSPSVTPALDWGGCGGAAGAYGEVFMRHVAGQSYFCWAGAGGLGGPAGAGGYPGGNGGHGQILITQFP